MDTQNVKEKTNTPKKSKWNTNITLLSMNDDLKPTPRYQHVAVVDHKNCFMYIFGGYSDKDLNDIFRYSFTMREWTMIEPKGKIIPSPRHAAAAVFHNDSMLLFGGYPMSNTVYRFDFVKCKWKREVTIGDIPANRFGHSCVTHPNEDYMILFGGMPNEVYRLNLQNMIWNILQSKGKIPSTRLGQSIMIHNEFMYVYYGAQSAIYTFHLQTYEWNKVECTCNLPRKRVGSAAVLYDNRIWTFGGLDVHSHELLNDVHSFDLNTKTWKKHTLVHRFPHDKITGRMYHSLVVFGKSMYIFGGKGFLKKFDELFEFSFPEESL